MRINHSVEFADKENHIDGIGNSRSLARPAGQGVISANSTMFPRATYGEVMKIRRSIIDHVEPWARLRAELWPDYSVHYHRNDVVRTFLAASDRTAAFICETDKGEVIGFSEATLRSDYVNGCKTSPVLFLEGIYVLPGHRKKGAARLLSDAVAAWGKSMGCSEFASDALLDNVASHKFHAALGFEETRRTVFFRKIL